MLYAKNVLQDPAAKQQYQEVADKKEGLSAYNIAVIDLFNAPNIEEINLYAYTGKAGEIIKIKAYDDFKVTAVSVYIYNAEDSLVEEGNAISQGLYWDYTTTQNNTDFSWDKIVVRAIDTANDQSEKETLL